MMLEPSTLTRQPIDENRRALRRGTDRSQVHALIGGVGSHSLHAESIERVDILRDIRDVSSAALARIKSVDLTLTQCATDRVLHREETEIALCRRHGGISVLEGYRRDGS